MAKIVKDLNQGSVTRTMLVFAMPMLGASIIQMLYTKVAVATALPDEYPVEVDLMT